MKNKKIQNAHFWPPDIVGQDCSEQYSAITPYITLILLKKSTTRTEKVLQ